MENHKKQQLTARGWKVGSTDQFLGLTSEEAAYVELKLVLSDHLKQQRQQRKLTQGELGNLLRSIQSRVAKMEAGRPFSVSRLACALSSGLRNFERRLSSHDCTAGTSDCYLTCSSKNTRG